MSLVTVCTHTFDAARLKPGGLVLDAGCRDFNFTAAMVERGMRVVGLDSDPKVWEHRTVPIVGGGIYALVAEGKPFRGYHVDAGHGGHVIFSNPREADTPVTTMTMSVLAHEFGAFDLVKLDVEGAEYEILLTWPGGHIADQISVEFHEPTGRGTAIHGADVYDRITAHLGQWYERVQHEATAYDGGFNFYDSLWVRR